MMIISRKGTIILEAPSNLEAPLSIHLEKALILATPETKEIKPISQAFSNKKTSNPY